MIPIKSEVEIDRMRRVCGITAIIRGQLIDLIEPGITTRFVESEAERMIEGYGAKSAFKGYHGFPGAICISLNEEVVHGIAGERVIQSGDVVSVDVGVALDGFIGDCAWTVVAGETRERRLQDLLVTTERALAAGTEMAVAGNRLGDISSAVQLVAESSGFSVVREFVGHGIGKKMHEEPQIPNFGTAGTGPKLKYGMTLAIEPMVNMGSAEVEVMEDKWTVKTLDRKVSAHFENTILVGRERAEILTNPAYAGK